MTAHGWDQGGQRRTLNLIFRLYVPYGACRQESEVVALRPIKEGPMSRDAIARVGPDRRPAVGTSAGEGRYACEAAAQGLGSVTGRVFTRLHLGNDAIGTDTAPRAGHW
jgi:hypothetical protein